MRLLRASDVDLERSQTVFRHGRVAPLVAVVAFAAITAVAMVLAPRMWDQFRAWSGGLVFVAVPLALGCVLAWFLACSVAVDVLRKSRRPTNWVVRMVSDGLYVNVRSYLNAHFDDVGPTVAWIPASEVSRSREGTERVRVDRDREFDHPTRRWIDLELDGIDTSDLAKLCDEERTRQAPARKFLFVTTRTRFDHTPVRVPRPGVVRVDRVDRRMLDVLSGLVPRAEPVVLESSSVAVASAGLDERARELCRAGDRLGAIALVRRETGVSLTAAREHVEALDGQRAA